MRYSICAWLKTKLSKMVNEKRKYLRDFIFLRKRKVINIAEMVRENTDFNNIQYREPDNINSHSIEIISPIENNNSNAPKIKDKIEMKNILKKYIKNCVPKHLIRKTSCYYVPYKSTKNDTAMIKPKQINRRSISQINNGYACNIDSNNIVTKNHRTCKLYIKKFL